jgi:predicted RNA methylase
MKTLREFQDKIDVEGRKKLFNYEPDEAFEKGGLALIKKLLKKAKPFIFKQPIKYTNWLEAQNTDEATRVLEDIQDFQDRYESLDMDKEDEVMELYQDLYDNLRDEQYEDESVTNSTLMDPLKRANQIKIKSDKLTARTFQKLQMEVLALDLVLTAKIKKSNKIKNKNEWLNRRLLENPTDEERLTYEEKLAENMAELEKIKKKIAKKYEQYVPKKKLFDENKHRFIKPREPVVLTPVNDAKEVRMVKGIKEQEKTRKVVLYTRKPKKPLEITKIEAIPEPPKRKAPAPDPKDIKILELTKEVDRLRSDNEVLMKKLEVVKQLASEEKEKNDKLKEKPATKQVKFEEVIPTKKVKTEEVIHIKLEKHENKQVIVDEDKIRQLYENWGGLNSKRARDQLRSWAGDKLVNAVVEGKQYLDFYPTPNICLDKFDITAGGTGANILEASAGFGAMIYYAIKKDPTCKITAYEINKPLCEFLEEHYPKVNVVNANFLTANFDNNKFDVILCNPPFSCGTNKTCHLDFLFKCIDTLNKSKVKYIKDLYFISPQLQKEAVRIEHSPIAFDDIIIKMGKPKLEKLMKEYNFKDKDEFVDYFNPLYIEWIGKCKFKEAGAFDMYKMQIPYSIN